MSHFTKKRTNPSFHVYEKWSNKFLAVFSRTKKFFGGSTKSLAYTDHIIQFGLNKVVGLFFGCERRRKISGLCSMKSRIKVIKKKKEDWC